MAMAASSRSRFLPSRLVQAMHRILKELLSYTLMFVLVKRKFVSGKLLTQNSLHRMLSTTCTRVQASPTPKR
jgi:hypothetical protein